MRYQSYDAQSGTWAPLQLQPWQQPSEQTEPAKTVAADSHSEPTRHRDASIDDSEPQDTVGLSAAALKAAEQQRIQQAYEQLMNDIQSGDVQAALADSGNLQGLVGADFSQDPSQNQQMLSTFQQLDSNLDSGDLEQASALGTALGADLGISGMDGVGNHGSLPGLGMPSMPGLPISSPPAMSPHAGDLGAHPHKSHSHDKGRSSAPDHNPSSTHGKTPPPGSTTPNPAPPPSNTAPPPTSGGTGSTAKTFGTKAMPTVSQSAPGFYVAANGSANGNGTAAHPFATLQQAQQAMQNSNIKTTYVEGGTYKMGSTLQLTSKDSGESFIGVGGANNPAVLDGGGKLNSLISLNQANNVNVEGFSMQNTSNSAVWGTQHASIQAGVGAVSIQNSSNDTIAYNDMNNVNVGVNMQGASGANITSNSINNAQSAIDSSSGSNNTIDSNMVDNITGYGGKLFNNVGAINILGDNNVTIDNNVVENTAGVGIEMNYRQSGSGFNVNNNTIENTDTLATTAKPDTSSNPVGDDGAIHIIVAPGSTKQLNGNVDNNYIQNAGVNHADKGIYLDDGVNGVSVTGNYVDEGGAGYAVQVHGGSNNTVEENIFVLGNGKEILVQSDGYTMTGNVIQNNTVE